MERKTRLPFEGIRVCDFTWYAAGTIPTRVLAEFGAEVIKIESVAHIDALRLAAPTVPDKSGVNVGGWANNLNSGKKGIALNMNFAEAREVARRLIKVSDIVIENFVPHVMEDWGLSYEEVAKVKPDIIMVRMPMWGLWGPHRDYVGFGVALQSLTGFTYLSGYPDRIPIGTGVNYPDYAPNPYHTVLAMVSALRHRRKTGKGQLIEVSQYESTVATLDSAVLDYTVNGRVQTRQGNRVPHAAPHSTYPCKGDDRWCAIAVASDGEWQAFCNVIGNLPWTREERFATHLGRKANEEELDRLVAEWTAERTAEEVMMLMQMGGVAAGVVQTSEDLLVHDPHIKAREHYVRLDHAEAGRTAYDSVTIKLSRTPGSTHRPAPMLGEHNDEILRDLLGIPEEDIDRYILEHMLE